MTATKKPRSIVFRALGTIFLLLFIFSGYSIYRFKTNLSPRDLALRKKLVGTWIGENRDGKWKTEFCDDGTIRSFAINGNPTKELEWTAYSDTLQIYSIARKSQLRQTIGRFLLGEYGLGGKIEQISDNQMQVRFYASGERVTYKKAMDSEQKNPE
jgi:hypothetical protein